MDNAFGSPKDETLKTSENLLNGLLSDNTKEAQNMALKKSNLISKPVKEIAKDEMKKPNLEQKPELLPLGLGSLLPQLLPLKLLGGNQGSDLVNKRQGFRDSKQIENSDKINFEENSRKFPFVSVNTILIPVPQNKESYNPATSPADNQESDLVNKRQDYKESEQIDNSDKMNFEENSRKMSSVLIVNPITIPVLQLKESANPPTSQVNVDVEDSVRTARLPILEPIFDRNIKIIRNKGTPNCKSTSKYQANQLKIPIITSSTITCTITTTENPTTQRTIATQTCETLSMPMTTLTSQRIHEYQTTKSQIIHISTNRPKEMLIFRIQPQITIIEEEKYSNSQHSKSYSSSNSGSQQWSQSREQPKIQIQPQSSIQSQNNSKQSLLAQLKDVERKPMKRKNKRKFYVVRRKTDRKIVMIVPTDQLFDDRSKTLIKGMSQRTESFGNQESKYTSFVDNERNSGDIDFGMSSILSSNKDSFDSTFDSLNSDLNKRENELFNQNLGLRSEDSERNIKPFQYVNPSIEVNVNVRQSQVQQQQRA